MTRFEDPRESGVTEIDGITPEYDQPDVSISSQGRYVEHEVIGGMTVRQKVGEEPKQISVTGLCLEDTASDFEDLHREDFITFTHHILGGAGEAGSMNFQVESVDIDPFSSGGGVATSGDETEMVYQYNITLVEAE